MTHTYKPYTRECYVEGCSGTMCEMPERAAVECDSCGVTLTYGLAIKSIDEIRAVVDKYDRWRAANPGEAERRDEQMEQVKARIREETARRYAERG